MSYRRTLIITLVIVGAVVGGSAVYLFTRSKPENKNQAPAASTQTDASTETAKAPEATPPVAVQPGKYIQYTPAGFAEAKGRRVLFFHAPWCPQCRNLDKTIKSDGVPAGMTVFKVDYDTHQQLRQKYGVTLQTTLVEVDSTGNLEQKHVAYDQPTWNAALNALGR